MTQIVNTGPVQLTYKKEIRASVNCPNCNELMHFDAGEVDIGNIVKCDNCNKLTYYPFERPWYRKRKIIVNLILSNVVAFLLGLFGNFAYDKLKGTAISKGAEIKASVLNKEK